MRVGTAAHKVAARYRNSPQVRRLCQTVVPLAGLLAQGGRIVSTLGYGPDRHAAAVAVMARPDAATLERLAADVASGALRVPITRSYALAEVPQALADFGAPHHGKLAVTI